MKKIPLPIKILLEQYVSKIKKIYGEHLNRVILYGSYARGDFNQDSDIDIMILVNLTERDIEKTLDNLSELGFEYNVEYDIWIMPIVKNIEHFNYWVEVYPFYQNVEREGLILYKVGGEDK